MSVLDLSFFFSSRRRHTRLQGDWSSDVCSSDLPQNASAATSDAALSRAEVIADLALWRRAGLDRHAEISISYGVETPEYRAAYQEYLRLRNSEAFQAEVRKALSR